jgi:hypothetical protein
LAHRVSLWQREAGNTGKGFVLHLTDETSGKKIALFRCTQLILYPRG